MDVANELIDLLGLLISEVPELSEDCLYLNIYSPANKAPDAKLPVKNVDLNMCIHASFQSTLISSAVVLAIISRCVRFPVPYSVKQRTP